MKRFFKALGPATVGSAGVQLALFADTIIASFLAAGALSALYYADRLYQLPGGVIGIAVGTVLLPEMARRLAAGDDAGARAAQARAIEFTLLLAIPCVAAFLIVPDLIMRALFMRGKFTAADAQAAAWTLAAYTIGLIPFVLMRSVVATFLARGDTATTVKAALTAVAVNIALKLVFLYFTTLAQVGLALATAIGAWVNFALILWFGLRAGFIGFDGDIPARSRQARGSPALLLAAALFVAQWPVLALDGGPARRAQRDGAGAARLASARSSMAGAIFGLFGKAWLRVVLPRTKNSRLLPLLRHQSEAPRLAEAQHVDLDGAADPLAGEQADQVVGAGDRLAVERTIMSPVSRPARLAGLPGTDSVMVAAEPCARPAASCMRRGIEVCCADIPMKARRTRPCRTSSPSTNLAVFAATAKQMPCAPWIMAVFTPITSPCEETSGPPELPGLSAASVWITSSISRPVRARNERPSAETTPAVTVDSKPSGLPIATTSWPRRSRFESPSAAAGSVTGASTRTSARSVSGSSPTTRAVRLRPSVVISSTRAAPPTTWLLVSTRPSGATMTPEPEPARAALRPCQTSMRTTAGPTRSTTSVIAAE